MKASHCYPPYYRAKKLYKGWLAYLFVKKVFLKHKVVPYIFSKIPLYLLWKLTRTNLIILYYHMVSDDEVLHIKHLYHHKSIQQFKDDLDFLLKNYNPISLFDFLDFLKNNRTLPRKAFLLTFDDGFSEMYDIAAPILFEKGIPATIFLNSGFIDNKSLCYQHKASILAERFQEILPSNLTKKIREIWIKNNLEFKDNKSGILSIRYQQKDIIDEITQLMNVNFNDYLLRNKPYLTSGQIRRLIKEGFTIGAHSIDHPLYSSISLEDQLFQTIESVKFLKERFCLDYGAFAFPHNDNDVSKEFFEKLHKSGLVDVSFGTGGMIGDTAENNFQRISLENLPMPAERIIPLQDAKKLFNYIRGCGKIIRL